MTAAYRVLRPFLLGGRRRAPDTEIELTPRQARYLLLDGRIERVAPPASPDAGDAPRRAARRRGGGAGRPPSAGAAEPNPPPTAAEPNPPPTAAEPKPSPRRGKKSA